MTAAGAAPVPEPERRLALRAEVLSAGAWTDAATDELTAWCWSAWGDDLAAAGLDRAWLATVVAGYNRELWLWTMGERPWDAVATSLAGRVARRRPA